MFPRMNVMPAFVGLLVLGACIVETARRPASVDAEPYHRNVRAEAERFPYRIGVWLGRDEPVATEAKTMLKPNALISRKFENIKTGEAVEFLLVQCSDTRDILGHYPPICYRGNGWELRSSQPIVLRGASAPIRATEYVFVRSLGETTSCLIIENFMLLSDGSTAPDMEQMRKQAASQQSRFFGAAQVQLIFHAASTTEDPTTQTRTTEDRLNTAEEFLSSGQPLFAAIGRGGQP